MTVDCNMPHLHIAANLSLVIVGVSEKRGRKQRAVKAATRWTYKRAHIHSLNAYATRILTTCIILRAYVATAFDGYSEAERQGRSMLEDCVLFSVCCYNGFCYPQAALNCHIYPFDAPVIITNMQKHINALKNMHMPTILIF